jgi:tRNA 2-thiouridine synthesizing protein A
VEATDEQIAEQLQAKVDALRGRVCCACQSEICGHELLFSIAMGLGDNPRCANCLADGLGRPTSQLRDHLQSHFRQRSCYGEVWQRESEREGFARGTLPGCLWAGTDTEHPPDAEDLLDAMVKPLEEPDVIGLAAEAWDAGEMACGDLVLALRQRMNALPAGTRLKLTAQDAGATEDIPAWCRMTGHVLLAQHHPHYWIQRKE